MQNLENRLKPMPEQITYANLLFWGSWAGIAIMFITYFIYLSGALTPHAEISVVTQNWGKGVHEFMQITNAPHGWGWVNLIGQGDYINFIGLSLLALLTIVCYLVLIPGYVRRGEKVFAAICIAEVLVLSLAASGLLGAGGH